MSGEQCAEELLGPSLEGNSLEVESESNDARPCRCAVVALQDRRCQKVPSKLYLKKWYVFDTYDYTIHNKKLQGIPV